MIQKNCTIENKHIKFDKLWKEIQTSLLLSILLKIFLFTKKKNTQKKNLMVEFVIILRVLFGLILKFFIKYLIKKIEGHDFVLGQFFATWWPNKI